MKSLFETYKEFKGLKFPQSSTNESLDDLFTDLVQYDSFIAGAVDKLLKGKSIKPNEIYFDLELEKKLTEFVLESRIEKDNEIARSYLLYLESIRNLVNVAKIYILTQ